MCFQSNGTSAATNEGGRAFTFAIGGVFYGSGGSLSAVSASDGAYMANFSASKVSVLGHGMVLYSSNTALPWMTPFEVVAEDPWTSSVTIHPGTYSDVTIQGVTRALNLSANGDKAGYSISGTKTTLDALSDIDGSGVTLHAGTHSGATIQGLGNYANMPTSVEFTASSITSIAAAVVDRTIDNTGFGGRTVGSALAAIRNRVEVSSRITVYDTDDTTVLWSGTATEGGTPISGVDPA